MENLLKYKSDTSNASVHVEFKDTPKRAVEVTLLSSSGEKLNSFHCISDYKPEDTEVVNLAKYSEEINDYIKTNFSKFSDQIVFYKLICEYLRVVGKGFVNTRVVQGPIKKDEKVSFTFVFETIVGTSERDYIEVVIGDVFTVKYGLGNSYYNESIIDNDILQESDANLPVLADDIVSFVIESFSWIESFEVFLVCLFDVLKCIKRVED